MSDGTETAALRAARRLCEDFKDRPCESIDEAIVAWPDEPVRIGRATEIVYRSDKWITLDLRRRGTTQDYYHPFETAVQVVVCRRSPLAAECVRPPRRARLARPPGATAQLADCLELSYDADDGRGPRVVRCDGGAALGDSPRLLAFRRANGADSLVIDLHDGAVVLMGGRLRVRPEGITG